MILHLYNLINKKMKKITFILIASMFLTNFIKAEDNKIINNDLSELDNFMNSQEQVIKYSAPDFIETSDINIHEEELNNFMEITEEFLKYNPNNFENTMDASSVDNFEAFIELSLKYKAPSEDNSEIITNEFDSLTDYIDYTIASLKYTAPAGKEINKMNLHNYNLKELACIMN